ncbi:MAG: MFS transporter [Candidatus Omnitrophica bacterium]|nr:MFS transporter [Candidatus Omnitrophota bacterium]
MIFTRQKVKQGSLIFSWALYDLASQFFVLNVISLYFARWLVLEKGAPEILYSLSFGFSNLLIAFFSPSLGVLSDTLRRRRPFLILFTLITALATSVLGVRQNILLVLFLFALANFAFHLALIFYNALMEYIVPEDKAGLISGLGRMFGYTGAIFALYLIKPIAQAKGYQSTFLPTAILYLLLALPCMIFIKDRPSADKKPILGQLPGPREIAGTLKDLWGYMLDARRYPVISNFLKASFFVLCGVNVIVLFMSIYATQAFGLNMAQVTNLIALSAVFAVLGSLASGILGDRLGHLRLLRVIFILWVFCFLFGAFSRHILLYWVTGALVGIALGATWTVARALAMKLVPRQNLGKIFGLFNLATYLAAIVGPLFWSLFLFFLKPLGEWGYRLSMFVLIWFTFFGIIFLSRIPKEK